MPPQKDTFGDVSKRGKTLFFYVSLQNKHNCIVSSVAGKYFIDHAAFHIVFHTLGVDVSMCLESIQQNLICASFSNLFALMRPL